MRRFLRTIFLVTLIGLPLIGRTPLLAQSGNTWTAFYHNNQDWAGMPVMTQSVTRVAFNWGHGSPGLNVPVDHFTGRFETNAFFYAGTYRFTLIADDEVTLLVGGVTHIDTRGQGMSGKTVFSEVHFPLSGMQQVVVFYREFTHTAYVWVDWEFVKGAGVQPPGPDPTPPPQSCAPPSATSVVTQFGNFTPCIQQNLHQSHCFVSNGEWNAPNMGSIQMEPRIEIWGYCEGGSRKTRQVSCHPADPPMEFVCSRTWAGWFPR